LPLFNSKKVALSLIRVENFFFLIVRKGYQKKRNFARRLISFLVHTFFLLSKTYCRLSNTLLPLSFQQTFSHFYPMGLHFKQFCFLTRFFCFLTHFTLFLPTSTSFQPTSPLVSTHFCIFLHASPFSTTRLLLSYTNIPFSATPFFLF